MIGVHTPIILMSRRRVKLEIPSRSVRAGRDNSLMLLILFGVLQTGVLARANARCIADLQNGETKYTATFAKNLSSIKFVFAVSSEIHRRSCLRDSC